MANEIKTRRIAKGLSQEEVAEYVGITRVTLVNIEAGRNRTTAENLWAISNVLGCTMNDLFPKNIELVRNVTVKKVRVIKQKKVISYTVKED